MKIKHSDSFTIIEILVVISVISILLGVIIPRFKGMQDEANKSKAKTELKTLQTALESWYINHNPNAYPDVSDSICSSNLNSAEPLIVSTVLYDPFRGGLGYEYSYILSPNGRYYVLFSYGPNGSKDISDIDDDGTLSGLEQDDIFVTNGVGF